MHDMQHLWDKYHSKTLNEDEEKIFTHIREEQKKQFNTIALERIASGRKTTSREG